MTLKRFKEYVNRYTKTKLEEFKITDNQILMNNKPFWNFDNQEERTELLNLPDEEKAEVLNGLWNFYMVMMD